MPDSYTNLLYHLVFSTKDRRALITPDYEVRLHDYIGGILRNVGGISLALNGTSDHIHLLAKLRPDHTVAGLIRDLKSNSQAGCMMYSPHWETFPGNAGMGPSLLAIQKCRGLATTLRDKNSTINR